MSHATSRPSTTLKGIRGAFLDFDGDPFFGTETESVRYLPDGLLVIEDGHIKAFGDYGSLHLTYADLDITTYPDQLIVPGFIDLHVHYPQTEMIGAYGAQLMEWLEQYTFPTERKFEDPVHARRV